MRRRHLRGVVRIEEQGNQRPWSLTLFAGELKLPDTRTYVVALEAATVVGFAGLMYTGEEAHVTNIGVAEDRRGRGIGTRLMLPLMRECRDRGVASATLEVRATNTAAHRLYGRFGFVPGGVRPKYYRDEDAIIMWAHDLDGEDYGARLARLARSVSNPA